MWLSILIGAMIGCGLLTMVVTGLALLVNNFINNNTTVQDSSTPDSRSETTDPEAAATEEISTPSLSGQSGLVAPLEGQLIFFADRDDKNGADDYEIYRLNLSNQDEVQLTSDDSANMNPAGSPDGQRIAFQSDRDGDFDIYSVNPMGGALMKVVQNQVDDVMPAWSPDGEWLAFASDTRDDGALDLFIVRPDGTDLRRVLTNERRNSSPRWSPDGQSLVFTTGDPTNASTWEIAILDLTTERMRKLTENDVRDTWADFSPDGASLVYITGSDGATSIARLTVDSAREPDILYEGGEGEYIWSPHYSLDGSYIIFNAGTLEDAIGHVYVMKVDEDEAGRQRLDVDKGLYASWLP
jgi:TolB protein